jgi:hypothetical protein
MESTPEVLALVERYEGQFRGLLNEIEAARLLDEPVDEEVPLPSLAEQVNQLLRTSGELQGILVGGIESDSQSSSEQLEPFEQSAARRLAASAAGDFLAGEALALLVIAPHELTSSWLEDRQRDVSLGLLSDLLEGPSVLDHDVADEVRFSRDPAGVVLRSIRFDFEFVSRGMRGERLPGVSGGARRSEIQRVERAVDEVISDGAETLEKTILSGIFVLGGSEVMVHLSRFLGQSFLDPSNVHSGLPWVIRKVFEFFDAARSKITALFSGKLDKIKDPIQRLVDKARERFEEVVLGSIFHVDELDEECRRRLNGCHDEATKRRAVEAIERVPSHCRDWTRWARYGARGIRVARSLAVFGSGGTLWPVLLAASAGLSGYTLWVVQDHLDWPSVGWIPGRYEGVARLLP